MLQMWEMWSTLSLPSLSGSLLPKVVKSDRVLSVSQIELFDIYSVWCKTELFEIELFDHLTVSKQITDV